MLRSSVVLASVALAGLAACKSAPSPYSTTTLTSARALDDAQIAEAERAALAGLADEADLARSQASSEALKTLALQLASDYRIMLQRHFKLRAELGLSPEPSALSQDVTDDSRAKMKALAMETPGDFDRACVDTEVDSQRAVLHLIEAVLLPAVEGQPLRNDLLEMHRTVAFHEDQARKLQAWLDAQTPGAEAPAPSAPREQSH